MKSVDFAEFQSDMRPAENHVDVEKIFAGFHYTAGVEICDADAIPQQLRLDWDALSEKASEPNPFAERFYVEAGVRAFAKDSMVKIIAVRQGGKLCGIMPLSISNSYGRQHVRHATNWQHCNSFLGTPLVRKGMEEHFWNALLNALDKVKWVPGFLHLQGLSQDGPVFRKLVDAAAFDRRSCDVVHREDRPMMVTSGTAEHYLADRLSSKRRGEYARKRRRLADMGRLETRTLAATDDFESWYSDFLALEGAGWKGAAGSAINCCSAKSEFFHSVMKNAHEAGRLYFMRMDLDGHAIAMQTSLLSSPGAFGLKCAYDENYARYSPGLLLQIDNMKLIEREDINWQDSCSRAGHPIGGIWSETRPIVQVTVGLSGMRRRATLKVVRAIEQHFGAMKSLLKPAEQGAAR